MVPVVGVMAIEATTVKVVEAVFMVPESLRVTVWFPPVVSGALKVLATLTLPVANEPLVIKTLSQRMSYEFPAPSIVPFKEIEVPTAPLVGDISMLIAAATGVTGKKILARRVSRHRTESDFPGKIFIMGIFTIPLFVVGLTFGYRLGYCHYSITITKTST
jgi:hypothetical protein